MSPRPFGNRAIPTGGGSEFLDDDVAPVERSDLDEAHKRIAAIKPNDIYQLLSAPPATSAHLFIPNGDSFWANWATYTGPGGTPTTNPPFWDKVVVPDDDYTSYIATANTIAHTSNGRVTLNGVLPTGLAQWSARFRLSDLFSSGAGATMGMVVTDSGGNRFTSAPFNSGIVPGGVWTDYILTCLLSATGGPPNTLEVTYSSPGGGAGYIALTSMDCFGVY